MSFLLYLYKKAPGRQISNPQNYEPGDPLTQAVLPWGRLMNLNWAATIQQMHSEKDI